MSHLLVQKNKYGQNLIALLDESYRLKQLFIQRSKMLNRDEIIQGRITTASKSPRGYFIQTHKNLPLFAPSKEKYAEGDCITVQVTKEARLSKDATGKIITSENQYKLPQLENELQIKYQTQIQTNWDEYDLDEQLNEALNQQVLFKNGASLSIERTQTCWTIDIDSGSCSSPLEEINQKAIRYIYNQIILKNLSGIILIDFAGSKRFSEQEELKKAMLNAFEADTRTKIYGFTRSGLFELKRDRTTAALADLFLTPKGFKNPVFLSYLIKEELQKTKIGYPTLFLHPVLLPFLDEEIKNYAKIKICPNTQPDFFEIKGE